MKKTLLVFIMIFSLGLFAQTKSDKVEITFGQELKTAKGETLDDVVVKDEFGIIVLKTSLKGLKKGIITLERINQKMNLEKSVQLDLRYNKKIRNYEEFKYVNDKLYLFTSFLNKKTKTKYLFVQSVNTQTLSLNSDIQKIAEISYAGKSKRNSGFFDVETSEDNSKIMIYYSLPYDKGAPEKLGVKVFDNQMHQIWEKDIILPYKDDLFDVKDYLVDNKGNVMILGRLFNDVAKAKVKGEVNFKYHLLIYSDNGNKLDKHDIALQDKFITDMKIGISPKGNILCGGFYSTKGTFSIDGSYFLVFDGETKKKLKESTKEFGIDFVTEGMTEKEEKKTKKKDEKGKNAEMYQYELDNFIMREDGGGVLVAEQYWLDIVTTTSVNSQGQTVTHTTYHYHYNNIIVISISPDGDIEWTQKIIKNQHTTNDGGYYSSYAMAVVKDKLYFIFNDNPKNLMYKKGDKVYGYTRKNIMVSLVEIDGNGNKSKDVLLSKDDMDTYAIPKISQQISEDELILYLKKRKINQFVKIKFIK